MTGTGLSFNFGWERENIIEFAETFCQIGFTAKVLAKILLDECVKLYEGKHIICGGTTSSIAAEYLGKKLMPHLESDNPSVPPTAELEGADLVTEGIITISKVSPTPVTASAATTRTQSGNINGTEPR